MCACVRVCVCLHVCACVFARVCMYVDVCVDVGIWRRRWKWAWIGLYAKVKKAETTKLVACSDFVWKTLNCLVSYSGELMFFNSLPLRRRTKLVIVVSLLFVTGTSSKGKEIASYMKEPGVAYLLHSLSLSLSLSLSISGYAWAEDKEHCEEYGRMLQANPGKVSARAKKRGLPQVGNE